VAGWPLNRIQQRSLYDIGDGLGAAGKAASCFLGPALDSTGVYYSATKKGTNEVKSTKPGNAIVL
jgi:hypothetical protein